MVAHFTDPIRLVRYVLDTLLPDLVGHDRRPSAFLIYLAIVAGVGENGRTALSYAQLAERTGLSRRAAQSAVSLLQRRELVRIARRGPTDVSEYEPLTPWRR
jgi:DNA-binding FadR family transcriptional regulator